MPSKKGLASSESSHHACKTRIKKQDDVQTAARVAQNWSTSLRTSSSAPEPAWHATQRRSMEDPSSTGKKKAPGSRTKKCCPPTDQKASAGKRKSTRRSTSGLTSSEFTAASQRDHDAAFFAAERHAFFNGVEALMHQHHLVSAMGQIEAENALLASQAPTAHFDDDDDNITLLTSVLASASAEHERSQAWPPHQAHSYSLAPSHIYGLTSSQNPQRVSEHLKGSGVQTTDSARATDEVVGDLMERLEDATAEVVRQRGFAMNAGQEARQTGEEKEELAEELMRTQDDVGRLVQELDRAREGQQRAERMTLIAVQALDGERRQRAGESRGNSELDSLFRELLREMAMQQGNKWQDHEAMEEDPFLDEGWWSGHGSEPRQMGEGDILEDRQGVRRQDCEGGERHPGQSKVWGMLMTRVEEADRAAEEARERCARAVGELQRVREGGVREAGMLLEEASEAQRWLGEFVSAFQAEHRAAEQEMQREGKQGEQELGEVWNLTQGLCADLCASELTVEELRGAGRAAAQREEELARALEKEQGAVTRLMQELAGMKIERERAQTRALRAEAELSKERGRVAREREEQREQRERDRAAVEREREEERVKVRLLEATRARERHEERIRAEDDSRRVVEERRRVVEGVQGQRRVERATDRAVEMMADCVEDLITACEATMERVRRTSLDAGAEAQRRRAVEHRRTAREEQLRSEAREHATARERAERERAELEAELAHVTSAEAARREAAEEDSRRAVAKLAEMAGNALREGRRADRVEAEAGGGRRRLEAAGEGAKRLVLEVRRARAEARELSILAGEWAATEYRAARLERRSRSPPPGQWRLTREEQFELELGMGTSELIEEAGRRGLSCSRETVGDCKLLALHRSSHGVRIEVSSAGDVEVGKLHRRRSVQVQTKVSAAASGEDALSRMERR